MKLIAREILVQKGLASEKEESLLDIEALAADIYQRIHTQENGYDQRQLWLELMSEGIDSDAVQIAVNLLKRREKIIYLTD